jgi:hypothetical protein
MRRDERGQVTTADLGGNFFMQSDGPDHDPLLPADPLAAQCARVSELEQRLRDAQQRYEQACRQNSSCIA